MSAPNMCSANTSLAFGHGIVVEKHQGKISVDSKPGATRFTVKLPITDRSSVVVEEAEVLTEPS